MLRINRFTPLGGARISKNCWKTHGEKHYSIRIFWSKRKGKLLDYAKNGVKMLRENKLIVGIDEFIVLWKRKD